MKDLADKILELRKERGLSQMQLSRLTGIAQSNIARYELRKSEPSASVIVALCNFFEVSADYLLGLEDEMGNKPFGGWRPEE